MKNGELIQVKHFDFEKWETAVFVGMDMGKAVARIIPAPEGMHNEPRYFCFFREMPDNQITAWTENDIRPGMAFKKTEGSKVMCLGGWNKDGVWLLGMGTTQINYNDLATDWKTWDGKPCGVQV